MPLAWLTFFDGATPVEVWQSDFGVVVKVGGEVVEAERAKELLTKVGLLEFVTKVDKALQKQAKLRQSLETEVRSEGA